MRSKQAAETTISEKVLHLEKALEEVSVTSYNNKNFLYDFFVYEVDKVHLIMQLVVGHICQMSFLCEQALVEREEILEAAEKEIQQTKNIAIETEQKMMDDFEWKLREIESENRDKLKTLETSVASKVKTAQDEYVFNRNETKVK